MGFYSRVIFPRVMEFVMSRAIFAEYRREILSEVKGDVLEIGFGSGLNLPHYPRHIQKITTVDVNSGMQRLAQKRIQSSGIQVDSYVLTAEKLPMPDNTFDSVVSTWTLCSIRDVDQALGEVYRVLKPGGRYFFLEHGLSHERRVQAWQHRLNLINKIIGDGCNINRDIQALIEGQGFKIQRLDRFYLESAPKISGYMYKGIAAKA